MASSVKAGEGRLHNVRLAGGGFDHAIPPPRGSPPFLSSPAFTDASAPGGRKTMATWLTVRGSRNFVCVFVGAMLSLAGAARGQASYEVLHAFTYPGSSPVSPLVQASDGYLYGMTAGGGSSNEGGTVFRMDAAGTLTTLHYFTCSSTEGCQPQAGLIQANDGNFYGTTSAGGAAGGGTVFRMDAAGTLTTLHSFGCDSTEGCKPAARLIQASDGNFYGTTVSGGAANHGTVFKIDSAGTITRLHSFGCESTLADGCQPRADLIIASDGFLYGTTDAGGTATPNGGTIFKMDAAGAFTPLHSSFACGSGEGCHPGALIQAGDGNFYGVTGGAAGFRGTVFRMTAAGALTTLHSFGSTTEGDQPLAGLIQASDGNFYGTTSGVGPGSSTFFRMDGPGNLVTLHTFACSTAEGCQPRPGLIQASDGSFYGTTALGGAANHGTVFKADSAGVLTTLHAFACSGGVPSCQPSGLTEADAGTFYGTTAFGGEANQGTVFKMDSAGSVTTLHSFPCSTEGCQPNGVVVAAGTANLTTTTRGGGH